ncbi:hypothetical protein D9757_001538 [Collybiopsis confluens]|uniref:Uncharacterized protein n=1 Tax=Collybiopsis confluens TaxID=2823264 RepID=A0A8H5HZF2_9AGAR|nr:hypothetical protein D9757_001538 [Collybiopsis confluens]
MQSRATPNSRKKPHCRSCGSPMEGHKKSECPGYTDGEKSGEKLLLQTTTQLTINTESSARLSKSPVSTPSPKSKSKSKSATESASSSAIQTPDRSADSSSLRFGDSAILANPDSDQKPDLPTTPKARTRSSPPQKLFKYSVSPSLPSPGLALHDISDSDSEADERTAGIRKDNRKPVPVASIYAASESLSATDILEGCKYSSGEYHTGTFYTPVPVHHTTPTSFESSSTLKPKRSSKPTYKYKEWLIVGEDAELVRRVVGDSKPPGSFVRAGDEIVEGPRMVTTQQLIFASVVGGLVVWYLLSLL